MNSPPILLPVPPFNVPIRRTRVYPQHLTAFSNTVVGKGTPIDITEGLETNKRDIFTKFKIKAPGHHKVKQKEPLFDSNQNIVPLKTKSSLGDMLIQNVKKNYKGIFKIISKVNPNLFDFFTISCSLLVTACSL